MDIKVNEHRSGSGSMCEFPQRDVQMPSKARRRGHDEGSIYQRESDGRWVAVVDAGYINGKRRRFTGYGRTRKEATAHPPDLRRRAKLAQQETASIKTVREFFTYWMATKVKIDKAPKTVESYQGLVDNHILPVIGSKRLAMLNRADIQRMLDAVAAKEKIGPRSVENVRDVALNALNDAIAWRMIDENPAKYTAIAKVPESEQGAITVEEARRLFNQVKDDRFEALYIIAATYGLRRGECLGLRWEDIDTEANVMRVRQQVVVVNNAPMVTPLKTKKSKRDLPLLEDIAAALERRRDRQDVERLLAGDVWQERGLIFSSTVGTPYQPANLHKRWHAHLKGAGLNPVPFHSLRHTAASFLVTLNVHPRISMEMLGHTNIQTTMQIYSHAQSVDMRKAMESVEHVLRRASESDS